MNARRTTARRRWHGRRSAGIAISPELLLKAGADPNLTNEQGIGPLSLAITERLAAIS